VQSHLSRVYLSFISGGQVILIFATDYCRTAIVQDGAACCIVANESFVRAHKLENQAIEMVATGLATDVPDALAGRSAMDSVGYGMTRRLADKVFASAGANRDDVGVVELHDCFAANEVRIVLSALGTGR
jgi:sterol carrier protein 2